MKSQNSKVKSQNCNSKFKSVLSNVILAAVQNLKKTQRYYVRDSGLARMTTKQTFNFLLVLLTFGFCLLTSSAAFAAFPSSDNYQIQEYSFGSGGTKGSSSDNFGLFGTAGQVEFGRPSSANFKMGSGLSYIMQANVPGAPTFTNLSSNYDRLHFIINTSNNPTDTQYAIAISTDNFATDTKYIKNDDTIGATLTNADFQTYANWGGGTGEYLTGLAQNTTYTIKVKARQGDFTESAYGPTDDAVTLTPSLTFSVDSDIVTFDNLNSGNSHTDSSKITVLTTSTNAYNGYLINARSTGALTAAGYGTIADFGSSNSSPATWTGNGFGYTTNDSDLTGGTANRFTSGGPKYAGFTTSSPGDPVADHPGPVTTAISNENFTISYRVTTSETQPAARYSTTVLYIVVPSY